MVANTLQIFWLISSGSVEILWLFRFIIVERGTISLSVIQGGCFEWVCVFGNGKMVKVPRLRGQVEFLEWKDEDYGMDFVGYPNEN